MSSTVASLDETPTQSLRVRVVGTQNAYEVVAAESIETGAELFPVDGVITARPSRYSIQIDDHLHIDLGAGVSLEETIARHPWRFLNHSCEPSAAYRARTFVALRRIQAGEAITYNYHTTELDMAVPFDCRCGSSQCAGRISGFAHLSHEEQLRLRPLLAGHLLHRLDGAVHTPGA